MSIIRDAQVTAFLSHLYQSIDDWFVSKSNLYSSEKVFAWLICNRCLINSSLHMENSLMRLISGEQVYRRYKHWNVSDESNVFPTLTHYLWETWMNAKWSRGKRKKNEKKERKTSLIVFARGAKWPFALSTQHFLRALHLSCHSVWCSEMHFSSHANWLLFRFTDFFNLE